MYHRPEVLYNPCATHPKSSMTHVSPTRSPEGYMDPDEGLAEMGS